MAEFNFTVVVSDVYELIIEADNYDQAERIVEAKIDIADYGYHLDGDVRHELLTGPTVTQVA